MSIQERILQYIDLKKITPYKFCKDLGLSMGYLDKRGAIGTDKYLKIIECFTDINPEWLLNGDGEMLKNNKEATLPATGLDCDKLIDKICELSAEVALLKKEIEDLKRSGAREEDAICAAVEYLSAG